MVIFYVFNNCSSYIGLNVVCGMLLFLYIIITKCGMHFFLLKLHTIKFYKGVRIVKILEIAS